MRKYIEGNVDISKLYLQSIPDFLADVECAGEFDCSNNLLTSLNGMPKFKWVPYHIRNMSIYCYENKYLTSLKGVPGEIRGSLLCNTCSITSLENGPTRVGGHFDCSNNMLKTLKGGPSDVRLNYICSYNQLETLEGAPKQIGDDINDDCSFYCEFSNLKSLLGAPSLVYGDFDCSQNRITSLEGIPKVVNGNFDISGNKGKTFTRDEIRAVCQVGDRVYT